MRLKNNLENYMKTNSDKEKFIELRANGNSYDKISQELTISKPTLIKWGREYHKEIANRLFLDNEALLSDYGLRKKARIESLAVVLHNAIEELKSRPLEDLSTKDLLSVIQQLDAKIRQEVAPLQYYTGEYIPTAHEFLLDANKEISLPFAY